MKKPKLSSGLHEELKKHSKKDSKRRLIANGLVVLTVIVFAILAKVFIFKGDIKISDEGTKTPAEKIENQPEIKNEEPKTEKPSATAPAEQQTPAPADQPKEESYTVYVVKEGDTMSGVANANGMSSSQLMEYNGLVDITLMPGQNLKIPK